MKRKKIFFILLILFIGIGFAILSSNLSILSNLTIADASWNVYLYRPEIMDTNTEGNTYTLSTDNIELSLTSNLDKPGDYVVYDFYVINDGTIDAELNNLSITGLDSSYIDYSLTYYSGNTINDNDILKSKSSKRLKLFISYKYDVDSFINVSSISATISFKYIQPEYSENVWDYDFIEDVQFFTVFKSGTYKLEVWGAQGYSATSSLLGGYGGYSTGTIKMEINQKLYIYVGEKGKVNKAYPNGGSGITPNGSYLSGYGGGSTHISIEQNLISDCNANNLLLVAGGGGSSTFYSRWNGNGGSGGGYHGVTGIKLFNMDSIDYLPGGGGTQETGGTAGNHGNPGLYGYGGGVKNACTYAGGGGGYYGGGSSYGMPGGGGSGYIGNESLSNKVMYCYNCAESSNESTKTISTTNVSETPISNYAKIGNGYARITYLG